MTDGSRSVRQKIRPVQAIQNPAEQPLAAFRLLRSTQSDEAKTKNQRIPLKIICGRQCLLGRLRQGPAKLRLHRPAPAACPRRRHWLGVLRSENSGNAR